MRGSGGSRILKRGGSSVHVTKCIKRVQRTLGGVARGGHVPQDLQMVSTVWAVVYLVGAH